MKCKECDGVGKYEIKNAYNPDFSQVIDCEYCDGIGFEKGTLRYQSSKKPKLVS